MLQHIFLFNSLSSNKNFLAYLTTDSNIIQWKELGTDQLNQFNNATIENSNDPEKISSSKYCDINEMHNT